ncbi:MAG: hypothetical protein R6V04_05215 [bacterium]
MSIFKKLKNRKKNKKEKACTRILKIIKPGDVVNQITPYKPYQILLATGIKAIRKYQRHLFGKEANWKHDHCMLYLDKTFTLSVEPPKTIKKDLKKYCLNDISIYRLKKTALTKDSITILRQGAEKLVGTVYDVGQLLDIAINGMLGFEHTFKIKIFDFGKKKKVCSVGVRAVFEYLYQQKIKKPDDKRETWLFNTINPQKWPEDVVKKYNGTDIDATTPAHFANSDYFDNEFKLIARFKNGLQIYPPTLETIGFEFWRKVKGVFQKDKG